MNKHLVAVGETYHLRRPGEHAAREVVVLERVEEGRRTSLFRVRCGEEEIVVSARSLTPTLGPPPPASPLRGGTVIETEVDVRQHPLVVEWRRLPPCQTPGVHVCTGDHDGVAREFWLRHLSRPLAGLALGERERLTLRALAASCDYGTLVVLVELLERTRRAR